MIYPWQQKQWQQFQLAKQNDHLSHALLISGLEKTGKEDFATEMARSLLCHQPSDNGIGCGVCKSCHLLKAKSHPDFTEVKLLEGKKQILIDQIRNLNNFLTLSQSYAGNKIAIIAPADCMNENAANSLLKSLEEPTKNTIIILVTSQHSRLLPTILSRCQQITFPQPSTDQALDWLKKVGVGHDVEMLLSVASGKPLLAKEYDNEEFLQARKQLIEDLIGVMQNRVSITETAKQWEKSNTVDLIKWQLTWVQDLLAMHYSQRLVPTAKDVAEQLRQCANGIPKKQLWPLHDELEKIARLTDHPINKLLQIENMLLLWHKSVN